MRSSPANIEGDIITRALVAGPLSSGAGGGAVNPGEIHYYPFDADLECDSDTPTPVTGSVSVEKKDTDSVAPLPGAEFQLWRESNSTAGLQTGGANPDTKVGDPCVTGAAGICGETVPTGTYYWQETAAPDGYDLPDPAVFGPLPLTEDNTDTGVAVTAKDTKTPQEPDGSLHLKKSDANTGRPLEGAVVELWKESNGRAGLQTNGRTSDTLTGTKCTTDSRGTCDFDPTRPTAQPLPARCRWEQP
ncbi:collagen binding domain-containing protein [Streptomyces sp. NPDC056210]|uniref:MSCRAMM family protein n=1 Tax=Streptomyces sp. NPDC056210 TaxID=3345746 RepID=UPI0035E2C719